MFEKYFISISILVVLLMYILPFTLRLGGWQTYVLWVLITLAYFIVALTYIRRCIR